MAHDRDLAEDLAQSFFLKLLEDNQRRLRAFEPTRGVPLRAYLHVVASNLYLDWLRSREAIDRKRWVTLDGLGDLLPAPLTVEQEGSMREISGLLKSLPQRDRVALELLAGGATYSSIAGVLGLTANGTGTLIFRARARLRDLLRELE
jgi:RNA polymerase sigma factor (sigma-70 family)